VTLTPEYGDSFNGVTDYSFTLETSIDDDINDGAAKLSYLIENPNNADLSFSFDTYDLDDDSWIDEDEDIIVWEGVNGNFYDDNDEGDTVNFSKIVITDDAEFGGGPVDSDRSNGNENVNWLNIDPDQTDDILDLKVTAWIDRNDNHIVDPGEYQSTVETMNFYDPSTLSANAVIDSDNLQVGSSDIDVDVTFEHNVNVNYVQMNDWNVAVFKDGRAQALSDASILSDAEDMGGDVNALGVDLESYDSNDDDLNKILYSPDLTIGTGNYTVRVGYTDDSDYEDWTWASSRSEAFTVLEGNNGDVDGFEVSSATKDAYYYECVDLGDDNAEGGEGDNADTNYACEDLVLRSGVKAITYTAQAIEDTEADDPVALESSNVRVKVVVALQNSWADGTKLSIAGSSKVLTDSNDSAVIYGRTDAEGKFDFTVTDSSAADGNEYGVWVYYLDQAGHWIQNIYYDDLTRTTGDWLDNEYENAAVDSFAFAKNILAGSNVSATLEAEDQFGEPISKLGTKDLKVNIVDADDDTKLDKTATLVNGAATFTWSNYLAKGDTASIDATLFTGANVDSGTEVDSDTATVYNPEATGDVIADAEATGVVTYSDFVIGDSWSTDNDADTVAPADADKIEHHVVVEDTKGAGLPAAVVTVAGKGLLFEDDADQGTYYADSITVVANEQGEIDVNVWAHKVGEIVITTTSGGKSATTTLTTELNDSLTVDDVLISWNAPKHPAVNKLYVVSTSVTDKWGNGLPGATVDFNTDGVLQVNGDDQKTKDANSYGKATVYVGGVKNLSGVGSITAEITDLVIPADSIEGGELDLSSTIENGESTSITREVLVGTDATAAAGKLAGKLKVTAWNATGSAVQVYVGGKLVATRTASAKTFKFKLAGLAKGTKNVTVKVAGSTYFKDVVTIK
jgi:hypothetical protein